MTEFAFIRLPDGSAWLGEGPFTSSEHPGDGEGVFYINDFDLTDPAPWKRPARLHAVTADSLQDVVGLNGDAPPKIAWAKPATEWFKMAFRRIRREVLARRLEKMVPVLTESGEVLDGCPLQLLARLMAGAPNSWGYAYVNEKSGFMGLTPELLFRSHGREVETMALAGTAKPGDQKDFDLDVKEIEEHEIVVRYLAERLGQLGEVSREPRHALQAGGLRHFQSTLRVLLREDADPGQLVPWLHPTPAVGCLPREDQWLLKLREYRKQLGVPGFFGSPFGFMRDGVCQIIVAIRGISWEGKKVSLPSGCGIVGGSAFDHEWRELRLKREAVLKLLGI